MKDYKDSTILVIGAGTMGHSMALVMAAAGLKTYMTSRHDETLAQADARIQSALDILISEGMATDETREVVAANLIPMKTDDIPQIAAEVDYVFETVVENKDAKRAVYEMLDGCLRDDCIVSSNTSGMDVFTLTDGVLSHPENYMVAHWFNPPHLMKLVEVVRGEATSDEAVDAMVGLLEFVGRKPAVLNKFAPGFIVNRLATVINRELYYMIDEGWISGADAEKAIKYTHGLRFGFEGPISLWDFVGLEIPRTVAEGVLPSLCNETEGLRLADDLIAQGKTGVRAGEGVLTYPPVDEYIAKRSRRVVQMTKVVEQWDAEDGE